MFVIVGRGSAGGQCSVFEIGKWEMGRCMVVNDSHEVPESSSLAGVLSQIVKVAGLAALYDGRHAIGMYADLVKSDRDSKPDRNLLEKFYAQDCQSIFSRMASRDAAAWATATKVAVARLEEEENISSEKAFRVVAAFVKALGGEVPVEETGPRRSVGQARETDADSASAGLPKKKAQAVSEKRIRETTKSSSPERVRRTVEHTPVSSPKALSTPPPPSPRSVEHTPVSSPEALERAKIDNAKALIADTYRDFHSGMLSRRQTTKKFNDIVRRFDVKSYVKVFNSKDSEYFKDAIAVDWEEKLAKRFHTKIADSATTSFNDSLSELRRLLQ